MATAELTILIEKFDQAELYRYERAREISNSLLTEWLGRYKFKDCDKTQEREKLRTGYARAIARKLSNPDLWHSHSRGISMEALRRGIELQIDNFEDDRKLNDAIRICCKLLRDYMIRL